MSTGSFSAYCALTFKHAVEFSSFGCAPCFGFSGRCLGQLDLLYRASWSAVKPALFGPYSIALFLAGWADSSLFDLLLSCARFSPERLVQLYRVLGQKSNPAVRLR